MLNYILLGFILGSVNGLISRISLKLVINKPDAVFYSVWFVGMFYRLVFLVLAVLYLKYKNSIMMVPFAISLIFSQFIFEVAPIKKNGTQRNS